MLSSELANGSSIRRQVWGVGAPEGSEHERARSGGMDSSGETPGVTAVYAIELRWGVPRISSVWQLQHERSVYTYSQFGVSDLE
jgi:hypothetical protein